MLAVSTPVVCDPLSGRLPLQPPLAAQLVALFAVQVRVELLPGGDLDLGPALKETVGAPADTVTVVDWEAVPPGPVQLSK